jgi:hypothetical protein
MTVPDSGNTLSRGKNLIFATYYPHLKSMKMPKIIGLFLLLGTLFTASCQAQLVSYKKDGARIRYGKETTLITVHPETRDKNFRSTATPISLPSVLPGIIGAGFSITKTLLAQQQEKYTATYNASQTGIGLVLLTDTANVQSAAINIKTIDIARVMNRDETAMQVTLRPVPEPHTGLFRFQVDTLRFHYAKAKIKKWGRYGKTIDISVDVKLEAYWKEPATGASNGNKSAKTDTSGFVLKSGSLGESTILIAGITPTDQDEVYLDKPYYSGWFQTLPATALSFATVESDWKTGWYTLTVTIKEANPYGITSKQYSDFFSAASTDLSTLIKSFVPSK